MTQTSAAPHQLLHARQAQMQVLADLLASAAGGAGGALLLHGEPGIGKSVMLEHALTAAPDLRSLRVDGAEFAMELPYAALHQLCAPLLDLRHHLPEPQRAALETVFGLRDGDGTNPFLVALAVLGLLIEACEAGPLVCAVEDAQWLDIASLQALAFAARRLAAEPVAVVFVLRDPDAREQLAGLPRLHVDGLDDNAARALLAAHVRVPLDEQVRDRLVAEAHGNPLALLELPRGAGPLDLAGGFDVVTGRTVAGRLEESFAARAAALPAGARAFLVLAAAEPLGDPGLLNLAAAAQWIPDTARRSLEQDGLLVLGPRIRFRHPLVRSAAYSTATPEERRRAHAALAAATDVALDPDRRAWHRALAAAGPDEDVASELERSAGRARARGGLAASAAFLRRAAELSPERSARTGRTLGAAEATLLAGAPDAALGLLDGAGPLDVEQHAHVALLRAQVAFQLRRDADATAALLAAAGEQTPDLARETYLQAFSASMFLDRLPGRLQALAQQIQAAAPVRTPPRPVDLLLDALIAQSTAPGGEGVAAMRRATAAFSDDSSGDPRWLELVTMLALDLQDDAAARLLSDRQVHLARRSGALAVLPQALDLQALTRGMLGELGQAAESLAEARAVQAATGSGGMAAGDLILVAWRGDAARVAGVLEAVRAAAGPHEIGAVLYAQAVLGNGLGDYEAALAAALRAREQERLGSYIPWHSGAELIEAAVHAGQPEAAEDSMREVAARGRASGTSWAIGTVLQCQALLADDSDAGALYPEAVERFRRSGARLFLARSQLLYGEWLRRRGRRTEARAQLREAEQALTTMGAEGFAARARQELLATGEHPRRRSVDLLATLTAQELVIARRVASGATSKEVAADLFLSPRTIDAHLRNIFPKLGVTSRRQLRDLPL